MPEAAGLLLVSSLVGITCHMEMKFFACSLSCKSNSHPYERLRPWTCFEIDGKKQCLEMAYYFISVLLYQN